jgi:hypothetical protein
VAGEIIIGMDFRPADGLLYALGKDAGGAGHIYQINGNTAVATVLSTLVADPTDTTNPYTGLSGSDFGVDFNPVPDRLRLTSDTGQNLRINVSTGLVTTDANLNPGTPHVTGSAYTNSFAGATATTLFGIDPTTDQLLIQTRRTTAHSPWWARSASMSAACSASTSTAAGTPATSRPPSAA